MTTDTTLEALLRASTLTYGHVQLFRDDQGWQASVYHYEPKTLTNGRALDDPVDALRVALVEDDRKTRDLARRYAAAEKVGSGDAPVDSDGFCMICENGGSGCDACRATTTDDFEDMFG